MRAILEILGIAVLIVLVLALFGHTDALDEWLLAIAKIVTKIKLAFA